MTANQATSLSGQFALRRRGEGPPLVLLHGFGCDQSMWDPLLQHLGDAYEVITYDLAGMGGSAPGLYNKDRHHDLKGHALDLIGILEELDLGPANIVGHSVAASIAAIAANLRPELVNRLVMLSPNPRFLNAEGYQGGFEESDIRELLDLMDQNYVGWAGHLAGLVAGPDKDTATSLDDRFCRNDPEISRHFAEVTFTADNREDFQKISHPTMILQCAKDLLAPAAVQAYLVDAVPHAQQVCLSVGGHAPHMNEPESTARAIRGFLDDW